MTDNILVIDIGGISVKLALLDRPPKDASSVNSRRFSTPEKMTPEQFMQGVRQATVDWKFERVSIGFPAPVKNNRPVREPVNLGQGWLGFDYEKHLGCPVKMINDAAMQALGSYQGGNMLFLGLGTGLGTTLIRDDCLVAMELAHLPFKEDRTFEQVLGQAGLDELGETVWHSNLVSIVGLLTYALYPDYVVIGGGNARLVNKSAFNANVLLGDNVNAYTGGYRIWELSGQQQARL